MLIFNTNQILEEIEIRLSSTNRFEDTCDFILWLLHNRIFFGGTLALNKAINSKLKLTEKLKLLETSLLLCLDNAFPMAAELWRVIDDLLRTLCQQLNQDAEDSQQETKLLIDCIFNLGRKAAQAGLHTANTQLHLKLLEHHLSTVGESELADEAKNSRLNLEKY